MGNTLETAVSSEPKTHENSQEACLDKFKTIDFKYLVDNQICLGEVILERKKEGKSVYCLQKLREVVEILLEAKKELDGN